MLLSTSVACLSLSSSTLTALPLSLLSTPTRLYLAKPISNQEKLHLRGRRHLLWSAVKKVALPQPHSSHASTCLVGFRTDITS